jgi:hypothetical protein
MFTILVLISSIVSSALVFDLANAAVIISGCLQLPAITINKDGTITPETANITRNGDIYTLTTDLIKQYNIVIERDNVIFDGGGHFIDVRIEGIIREGNDLFVYTNTGIALKGVNNVTVRNVQVSSNIHSQIWDSNNCTFKGVTTIGSGLLIKGDFNIVTDCNIAIHLWGGSNNSITRNTLHGVCIQVYDYSNKFYGNNIYSSVGFDYRDCYYPSVSWDNGIIGNYWGDYLTKYPNASEISNTGIGNASYVINPTNIDFHPLMYAIGAPEINVTYTENVTYTSSFPLNFTVNKPIKWVGYSLDGAEKFTVTENTTLTGLPARIHNITVYATDVYGFEGASNTVTFTITAQTASPELFLTLTIVVAVGILAIIIVLCIVYWKKKP